MQEIPDDSSSLMPNVGGKKRPFDLFLSTDTVPKSTHTLDEVSKYNMVSLDFVTRTRKELIEDDFSAMKFWYSQKSL